MRWHDFHAGRDNLSVLVAYAFRTSSTDQGDELSVREGVTNPQRMLRHVQRLMTASGTELGLGEFRYPCIHSE